MFKIYIIFYSPVVQSVQKDPFSQKEPMFKCKTSLWYMNIMMREVWFSFAITIWYLYLQSTYCQVICMLLLYITLMVMMMRLIVLKEIFFPFTIFEFMSEYVCIFPFYLMCNKLHNNSSVQVFELHFHSMISYMYPLLGVFHIGIYITLISLQKSNFLIDV